MSGILFLRISAKGESIGKRVYLGQIGDFLLFQINLMFLLRLKFLFYAPYIKALKNAILKGILIYGKIWQIMVSL